MSNGGSTLYALPITQADLSTERQQVEQMADSVRVGGCNSASTDRTTWAWQDAVGIVASVGCAIHCAAMPFVIGFLPSLGLSFFTDAAFHQWMALACFLIALAAFVPGFRRHGNLVPAALGTAGLALITFAAFGGEGNCCSACSADTSVAIAANDSCCEDRGASVQVATDQALPNMQLASLFPQPVIDILLLWMTPIGGLLLVSAHLLNHSRLRTCNCCT